MPSGDCLYSHFLGWRLLHADDAETGDIPFHSVEGGNSYSTGHSLTDHDPFWWLLIHSERCWPVVAVPMREIHSLYLVSHCAFCWCWNTMTASDLFSYSWYYYSDWWSLLFNHYSDRYCYWYGILTIIQLWPVFVVIPFLFIILPHLLILFCGWRAICWWTLPSLLWYSVLIFEAFQWWCWYDAVHCCADVDWWCIHCCCSFGDPILLSKPVHWSYYSVSFSCSILMHSSDTLLTVTWWHLKWHSVVFGCCCCDLMTLLCRYDDRYSVTIVFNCWWLTDEKFWPYRPVTHYPAQWWPCPFLLTTWWPCCLPSALWWLWCLIFRLGPSLREWLKSRGRLLSIAVMEGCWYSDSDLTLVIRCIYSWGCNDSCRQCVANSS